MNTFRIQFIGGAFVLFLFVLLTSYGVRAQSSLFNIPTTDVLERGKTYLEADFDSHFSGYDNGGFQSFGAMAVRGIGKRAEVGMNIYFTKAGGPPQPIELQPNMKLKVYHNEDNGLAAAVGMIAYIPITHRTGNDTFGSVYAMVSKKIRGTYGSRFTAGGYALISRDRQTGNRKGALFGIEQPLHKRVTFIADWNTGKNRFGYSAAGVGFSLTKQSSLYTAYYFGNEGRGNNSLGIYYGIAF